MAVHYCILHVFGQIGQETNFAYVKEGVHHCTKQHIVGNFVRSRQTCGLVGFSHNLTHIQATTGEGEGAEIAPVITARLFIDLWSAAKFTSDDQKYFVL